MLNNIEAIIFDMDGVISHTQIIHSSVESEMLKSRSINMSPEEITKKYSGVRFNEMFSDIFKNFDKMIPELEVLSKEKWEKMNNAIESGVEEIPGTREFIEYVKQKNFPIAVASASNMVFIESVLNKLNLREKFDVLTSSEEVKEGKPAPDIFLLAARRLGVLPEKCLVIEDGISGMIGAKKAGMKCVALVSDNSTKYPADIIINTLANLRF